MVIPTEPIGSTPRTPELLQALAPREGGDPALDPHYEATIKGAIEQLGTTDGRGFAPFCNDASTSRETAFAKIRARVEGTALAAGERGGGA